MMKRWMVFLGIFVAGHVHAMDSVDVYGMSPQESAVLLQKYSKRVIDIMVPLNQESINIQLGHKASKKFDRLVQERRALMKEIKKKEGLLFVYLDIVSYPNNTNNYMTIDVVKTSDKDRLRFVGRGVASKKYPQRHDIVTKMAEYTHKSFQLYLTHPPGPNEPPCPVYHCFMGFNAPELKPYLPLFNAAAVQQRTLILDTLNHDQNPERRGAAAFLVGHFKDPRDIVATLLPHVNDSNEGVRNNVIRVLSTTLFTAKINDIDARPFLTLLDSPVLTDRNKSLFVLDSLAQSKKGKTLLIQEGRDRLLAILQLKQPNNHDFAYLILKKISGQNYGEYDMRAWRDWFNKAQTAAV